jgi:DNA sulfur modification protein DndC
MPAKSKSHPHRASSESTTSVPTRYSGFTALGFKQTIEALCEEIRELYLEDKVPWIIGYSGGKDSTATLQLIWMALKDIPAEQKTKTVHVISTDTLVENPIVSSWVRRSLEVMGKSALEQEVPIKPKLLHPRTEESFWVNLIGRG